MTCLNCGKPVDSTAELCEYCGVGLFRLPTSAKSARPAIRRVGSPGYMCFVLGTQHSSSRVFEKPDRGSRVLFTLGQGEPVPIVSEQGEWLEFLLPGEMTGFVPKVAGRKLEIAGNEKAPNPLGYYRVNTEVDSPAATEVDFWGRPKKIKEVNIYTLPDESAEVIVALQAWQCVPIVEEREGWFKVQLDDGVRGFVPEKFGLRTLRKESLPLPKAPDDEPGSSVLGGIATFVGLMTLGAIVEGIKSLED